MAGGKQGDEGHGGWVQHIHGNLYVPVSWEMVYVKKIKKLLTLCSSSKTFSWRTSWDGPYGEPSSERSTTIKIICPTSFQKPIFHSTLSFSAKAFAFPRRFDSGPRFLTYSLVRKPRRVDMRSNQIRPPKESGFRLVVLRDAQYPKPDN